MPADAVCGAPVWLVRQRKSSLLRSGIPARLLLTRARGGRFLAGHHGAELGLETLRLEALSRQVRLVRRYDVTDQPRLGLMVAGKSVRKIRGRRSPVRHDAACCSIGWWDCVSRSLGRTPCKSRFWRRSWHRRKLTLRRRTARMQI